MLDFNLTPEEKKIAEIRTIFKQAHADISDEEINEIVMDFLVPELNSFINIINERYHRRELGEVHNFKVEYLPTPPKPRKKM